MSDFLLRESILYLPSQSRLVTPDLHIARLKKSADYFGYKLDLDILKQKLLDLPQSNILDKNSKYKCHIKLSKYGELEIEWILLKSEYFQTIFTIDLCQRNVCEDIKFYQHKTTKSNTWGEYIKILNQYKNKFQNTQNIFDIIFYDENKYITEGARTNIYIQKEKHSPILTPPISKGLLPGVMRSRILNPKCHPNLEKDFGVKILDSIQIESFKLKDLLSAHQIYISNAMIGFQKAALR